MKEIFIIIEVNFFYIVRYHRNAAMGQCVCVFCFQVTVKS